jgi:hypothetical protein
MFPPLVDGAGFLRARHRAAIYVTPIVHCWRAESNGFREDLQLASRPGSVPIRESAYNASLVP